MRNRLVWMTIVGVPLALITLVVGTAAALPLFRHAAVGLWNAPDHLPALAGNRQVHFEGSADDYARQVSSLLPAAIAQVEAAQGRSFVHPVTIGVYATPEAYSQANCLGSSQPVGVTPFGRVILSPELGGPQKKRLPAILTHELSHAHIEGWISTYAWFQLPTWFKEGLAVMVSDGGGAEFVDEKEARAAIKRGEHIAINDTGSIWHLSEIPYEQTPKGASPAHQIVMAYRQAGMFVTYLHDSDRPGFEHMMNAILDGQPFIEAVHNGYHKDVHDLWLQFARTN